MEPKQVIVCLAGVPYPNHLGDTTLRQRGRRKEERMKRMERQVCKKTWVSTNLSEAWWWQPTSQAERAREMVEKIWRNKNKVENTVSKVGRSTESSQ